MFKQALLSVWVLAAGAACAQTSMPAAQGRIAGGASAGSGSGGFSYTSMSGRTSYTAQSGSGSGRLGGTSYAGHNVNSWGGRSASYSAGPTERTYHGNAGRYAEAPAAGTRTPSWATPAQLYTMQERGNAYTVLENKYAVTDLPKDLTIYNGKDQKGYVVHAEEGGVNPLAKGEGLFKNPFGPPGFAVSGGTTCSAANATQARFIPLEDEQCKLTGIHGNFCYRYYSYLRSYVDISCARSFIDRIDPSMDTDQKGRLLKEYYDCLRLSGFNRFGNLSR